MSTDILKKTNDSVMFRLILKGAEMSVVLVLSIFLARILSPAEFGIIAIANMVIRYADTFTNFGLNNALVQKDSINHGHINTVFTIDLFISLTFATVTILSAEKIALFFNNQDIALVLRWMSFYYIITTFYRIPMALMRREINFKFISVVELLEGVLTAALAVIPALYGFSYWSIVISSLLVSTCAATTFMIKTSWKPKIAICRDMGELYSFGGWSFVGGQIQLLVSKVDYFVIGKYLGVTSLGLYEKSFELTERAMTGITMPVNTIFFSTFSRLKNDMPQVRQVFLDACTLLTMICYPILFGLIAVTPHFVTSCLGNQWIEMIMPLQILASACLFRVLLGMVASLNVAIGKYKIHTLINIFPALLFILSCFLLVRYGIVAISIAFLSYCFISFAVSFWIVNRNTKVRIPDLLKSIWCPLIGSVLMFTVVMALRNYLLTDTESLLQLLALVAAGGAVYVAWIFPFYKKGVVSFHINGVTDKKS